MFNMQTERGWIIILKYRTLKFQSIEAIKISECKFRFLDRQSEIE